MSLLWKDENQSIAVLTKKNGDTIELSKGTLFKYPVRPLGVKITGFTSKESDLRGPIGVEYLPWRGTRWGSTLYSFKGNLRHLIAHPVGFCHYGEHIDWESIELLTDEEELIVRLTGL